MKCVRCNLPLATKRYEGIEIDRCAKCGGIWLDEGELEKIIDVQEEKFSPQLIQTAISGGFSGIPEDEENSVELCPKCSKTMSALNYSYNTGVVIDRCPDGHGVWFDGLELDKIQANKEKWTQEISANRGQWINKMKAVESQNAVAMQQLRGSASELPSQSFVNRIVGAIMKILDPS